MIPSKRYSREIRKRAVRLVLKPEEAYASQWAAIESPAQKFGCTSETLRRWVRRAERDYGRREGFTMDERERVKELERESRELKRANEIRTSDPTISDSPGSPSERTSPPTSVRWEMEAT